MNINPSTRYLSSTKTNKNSLIMRTVTIEGTKRENFGTKSAKKLRKEGKVPCVLYGGDEVVHFAASALDFRPLIYTSTISITKIKLNGKEYRSILKDTQYDPITDNLIHADFQELVDKPIAIEIPISFEGTPVGTQEGGVILPKRRKIKVRGLPRNLPDHLEVNIEELEIGDSIKVGDLEAEGLEILTNPSFTVLRIGAPRAEIEIPTVEEAAEAPEGEEVPEIGEELEEGEEPAEEAEGEEAEAAEEREEAAEGEEGEKEKGGEEEKKEQ
jgi:large subunit ribosomal protein L25